MTERSLSPTGGSVAEKETGESMTLQTRNSRADICKYPYPEAINVAATMGLKRERDTLVFTSPAQKAEYERKVREARAARRKAAE